jgi:hypothetical protein
MGGDAAKSTREMPRASTYALIPLDAQQLGGGETGWRSRLRALAVSSDCGEVEQKLQNNRS